METTDKLPIREILEKVQSESGNQDLSGIELEEKLAGALSDEHNRKCDKCSERNKNWWCIDDPDYQLEVTRVLCGLPPVKRTFNDFEERDKSTAQALKVAEGFAGNPSGWVIFLGNPGTGKSHLAQGIAETIISREVGKQSAPVRFINSAFLLDKLRASYSATEESESFDRLFTSYCEHPILILEDLGMESSSPYAIERLSMILDHRYAGRMPTILTSNLTPSGLREKLNDRIADRVFDRGTGLVTSVVLNTSSYRTSRKG